MFVLFFCASQVSGYHFFWIWSNFLNDFLKKTPGDGSGSSLLIQQTRYVFWLLIFLKFYSFFVLFFFLCGCYYLMCFFFPLFPVQSAWLCHYCGRGRKQPRKVRKVNDRGGNEVTRPSAAQKKKNNVGLFIGGSRLGKNKTTENNVTVAPFFFLPQKLK